MEKNTTVTEQWSCEETLPPTEKEEAVYLPCWQWNRGLKARGNSTSEQSEEVVCWCQLTVAAEQLLQRGLGEGKRTDDVVIWFG